MRIAIIYDEAYPFAKGGGERRFYEIGSRLHKNNWKVDWITFQNWNGVANINQNGISYIGLSKKPRLINKSGNRSKTEPLIFFYHILRNLKIFKKYQCIWTGQWPILHLFPLIIFCKITRTPLVIDWWEVWNRNWLTYSRSLGWIGYILEILLLRWSAKTGVIVTDCNLELDRIQKIIGRKKQHYCIPNGIPWDEIGDLDARIPIEYDLCSLGRLKNHKRVDLILKSVWHLREQYGIVATAAIIGDGPERTNLQDLSKKLNLDDQINFFGKIPSSSDCFAILKKCQLCVISTISGGGGNLTLLEAYGCGVPVIAFRCKEGIDPELIYHGKTGLLVEPVDSVPLAASLASLLSNPEKISQMKRFVLAKNELYDWIVITKNYLKVFEKAMLTRSSVYSLR